MSNLSRRSLVLALSLAIAGSAFAQAPKPATVAGGRVIKLAVEPNLGADQVAGAYKPLLAYLQKQTGFKFELVTARNYPNYWSEMRSRKGWDLVFDEAHFTDYRIKFYKFEPLVRSVENTSYSLLAASDIGAGKTNALLAENIFTLPAPSLGYALLLEYYPNPMQQPDIRTTVSAATDAIDAVFADEGKAAMVPATVAALYSNMFEVVKTREFSGAAFSASPTLDAATKTKIRDALLKMHEDQDAFAALSELGISQFTAAQASDYTGASDILKSFYGYGL